MIMSGFHNLHIDLKIAREDILAGVNKVFHAEKVDVETLVKDTFDKIDNQVKDAVDNLVTKGDVIEFLCNSSRDTVESIYAEVMDKLYPIVTNDGSSSEYPRGIVDDILIKYGTAGIREVLYYVNKLSK